MVDECTMSISDARSLSKFSICQAATYARITKEKLEEYEQNPSYIPLSTAKRLLNLYDIGIDSVNFK